MRTAPKEATVTLTASQATVMLKALADAEHYRRDFAAAWCADCAATRGGACPDHRAYLAPADAYRDLAAELVHVLTQYGRPWCLPTTTGLGPIPRNRERTHHEGNSHQPRCR